MNSDARHLLWQALDTLPYTNDQCAEMFTPKRVRCEARIRLHALWKELRSRGLSLHEIAELRHPKPWAHNTIADVTNQKGCYSHE